MDAPLQRISKMLGAMHMLFMLVTAWELLSSKSPQKAAQPFQHNLRILTLGAQFTLHLASALHLCTCLPCQNTINMCPISSLFSTGTIRSLKGPLEAGDTCKDHPIPGLLAGAVRHGAALACAGNHASQL